MRKATIALIFGSLLALIGVFAYWVTQNASQEPITWGGPTLCVSEREYLRAGMESLLAEWKPLKSGRRPPTRADTDEQRLVIDLESRLLWLTSEGASAARDYVHLPAGLSWKLYVCSGNKVKEAPPLACLRPAYQRWHGTLALAGYGLDGVQFSCVLHGPYLNGNMNWGEGKFDPNTLARSGPREGFSSILMTDPRRLREIVQTRPALVTPENTMPAAQEGLKPMAQRRAIWQHLQPLLYQALEQQVTRRGYEVTRILAEPGPDFTAGLAGVAMKPPPAGRANKFWSFLLRRRRRFSAPYLFFTVDAQANGRWHCRTTQLARGSGAPKARDKFDFYIELPKSKLEPTRPRTKPELGALPWSVTLDDGTPVEIVGVCADSGSTWWGPDGSVLKYWPGFLGQEKHSRMMSELAAARAGRRGPARSRSSERDETGVAVALRVPSLAEPTRGSGRSYSHSSFGSTSVHYGDRPPLLDRFGQSHSPGQYIVLWLNAQDQDVISHALGIHVGAPQTRPETIRPGRPRSRMRGRTMGSAEHRGPQGQISSGLIFPSETEDDLPLQWVQLRNISLRPGQQTEFEMVTAEDAGDIDSTSKVQVRP